MSATRKVRPVAVVLDPAEAERYLRGFLGVRSLATGGPRAGAPNGGRLSLEPSRDFDRPLAV